MDYHTFWKTKGLKFITPKNLKNPEGFDVASVLTTLLGTEKFIEIGCGIGRIACMFTPEQYLVGVDINPAAINAAQAACPNHKFKLVDLEEVLPKANSILLYHVCLHIPDEEIDKQFKRFTETGANTIIIGEAMHNLPRAETNKENPYTISNQRSLSQYVSILERHGFYKEEEIVKKYDYYKANSDLCDVVYIKFTKNPLHTITI